MHIFVCTNERDQGHHRGSCGKSNSLEILTRLKRMARESGLEDVRVNKSGCLDKCEHGPTCVIYPEGTWYSLPEDKESLSSILEHIEGGVPSIEHQIGD